MPNVYTVPAVMPETKFGLTGIPMLKQNVMMIATMFQNQMVMDRGLGLDPSIMDRPDTYRQILIPAAVIEAVEDGEPRVMVTNVIVDGIDPDNPGKVVFHVQFVEREET